MMKPVPAAAIARNLPSVAISLAVTHEVSRRSAEVGYATTENLVRCLVEYFWKIIEQVNLGQVDLCLTEEQVQVWKERHGRWSECRRSGAARR